MDTSYIYAGTRSKALENQLLSETQVERLLSAKSVDEVSTVLQDTFLAPLLSSDQKIDITKALDIYIKEAKTTIESIAPFPEVLDILWLKYDYHNLKTIIKGKRLDLDVEDIRSKCFEAGKYSLDDLIKGHEDGTLGRFNNHFAAAAEKGKAAGHVFEIDLAMNEYYFKTIKNIALNSKDAFIQSYVVLLIDLFNIKASLRAIIIDGIDTKDVFVAGGTFSRKNLEKKKDILDSLRRIGSEKDWDTAIADYDKTSDHTLLEKSTDEYVSTFLKAQSTQVFSPAPLFAYFSMLKTNAQIIGAVIASKRAGVSEKELRTILRRVYT